MNWIHRGKDELWSLLDKCGYNFPEKRFDRYVRNRNTIIRGLNSKLPIAAKYDFSIDPY